MSIIQDAHDMHCGCNKPFAHLLDNIFPEGHRDRNKPISYIINRDYQQCLSGGGEETDLGMAVGTSAATFIKEEEGAAPDKEEDIGIEEQLNAAEEVEKR